MRTLRGYVVMSYGESMDSRCARMTVACWLSKLKCVGRFRLGGRNDVEKKRLQGERCRDACIPISEPSRLVYEPKANIQKDSRWSTTGSPRDGIGCSFKLRYFFLKAYHFKNKKCSQGVLFSQSIRNKRRLRRISEK